MFAPTSPPSGRLEVSILWHDVESGGAPPRVPQPFGSGFRGELDHSLRCMPRRCTFRLRGFTAAYRRALPFDKQPRDITNPPISSRMGICQRDSDQSLTGLGRLTAHQSKTALCLGLFAVWCASCVPKVGLPWSRSVSPRGNSRDTESRSSCGHLQGFGCGRQSEMERCTPSVVRRGPQTASVRLDNGAADR